MKELYKKISTVKQEIGKISKDKENPFFKSKYFDINTLLEHIEPLLQINGLVLIQPIKDGKVQTVIKDIESEEFEYSELQLPDLTDPQKLGSAITYYRRYTLQSLLGLQAEDDDGNKASQPPKNKQPSTQSRIGEPEKEKKWLNPDKNESDKKVWDKAIENEMPLKDFRNYYMISKVNGEKYLKELTNKL